MKRATDIHHELITLCREGDRKSQYKLYTLYSGAMLSISMRIVNNRVEAEDILQESFVKAFTQLDKYREESSFGAWLKRIVINHSLNSLRKRKVYFKELNEEIHTIPESEEEENEIEYTVEDIKHAMVLLPDGYRTIFSLFMFEGHNHKEIANDLGISEVTSRSQLSRAKTKLKEIILTNHGR